MDARTCVDWVGMSQGPAKPARPPQRAKKKAAKRKQDRAQAQALSEAKAAGEIAPTTMVTMKELATYLNVSRGTLWKLVRSGQVPHYRVGSQYRFDVVAVMAAMRRYT